MDPHLRPGPTGSPADYPLYVQPAGMPAAVPVGDDQLEFAG